MENIAFNNIVMDAKQAIFLWTGDDVSLPAGIRNLSLSSIIATTNQACFIGGSKQVPITGLRVHNLALTVKGRADTPAALDPPDPVDMWGCGGIPHAFYIRHARNVSLRDIEVNWEQAAGPWRSAVRAFDVQGLDIVDLVDVGYAAGDHPVVQLTETVGESVRGGRIQGGSRSAGREAAS